MELVPLDGHDTGVVESLRERHQQSERCETTCAWKRFETGTYRRGNMLLILMLTCKRGKREPEVSGTAIGG